MKPKFMIPLLAVILLASPVQAEEESPTVFNPENFLLKEKVQYLQQYRPEQMAIAVVKADEQPACHEPTRLLSFSQCIISVRPSQWIYLRWLDGSSRAPDDQFTILYWFESGKGRTDYQIGGEFIVLLSPGRTEDLYNAVAILDDPEKNIEPLRALLAELFPLIITPAAPQPTAPPAIEVREEILPEEEKSEEMGSDPIDDMNPDLLNPDGSDAQAVNPNSDDENTL